jgi:hypothetical protein
VGGAGDLPQIRVLAPPRSMARWITLRVGVPMLVPLVGMLVVGHVISDHAMVIGAFGAAGIYVPLLGVEMPLLMLLQRRRHERLSAAAPAGTIFAGYAVAFRPGTTRPAAPRDGVLLIGPAGLSFTRGSDIAGRPDLQLPWPAITEIDAAALGGNPIVGQLRVTDHAQVVHSWRVRPLGPLAGALQALQDAAQSPTQPSYPAAHHDPLPGHVLPAPPHQTTPMWSRPAIVAFTVVLAGAGAVLVLSGFSLACDHLSWPHFGRRSA